MDRELPIRITVIGVPPGVTFAIQRGQNELLPPSHARGGSLIFDFSVRVSERKRGGSPNVLGPYAQGNPDDRFIYLNSGTMAGQQDSCFTRRAKIKTGGITWKLVEQALAGGHAVLETQIGGRAGDGGPCCATVPLPGGWRVSRVKPSLVTRNPSARPTPRNKTASSRPSRTRVRRASTLPRL